MNFSTLALPSTASRRLQRSVDFEPYVPEDTPVHPDVLNNFYNGLHPFDKKRTMTGAQLEWWRKSEKIAGARPLPKHVDYGC
eukprot:4136200-Pyramimonas_sp.AAC.1